MQAIKIKYQNTRGLRTKYEEFMTNCANIDADIVCLTETWLNSNFFESEYLIDKFVSYRRDRDYTRTGTVRGGGCWIFHKTQFKSTRIRSFESDIPFVEDIWLEFSLHSAKLYLCNVYITSMSGRSSLYERFFDKVRQNLAQLNSEDRIIIVGDFNLSEITWSLNSNGQMENSEGISTDSSDLINLINFGNLKQHNAISNFRSEILDLVLSNGSDSDLIVTRSDQWLVTEDSYHPTLDIEFNEPLQLMESNESYKKFNFRKADYDRICLELESINWNFIDNSNLTQSVEKFYKIVDNIIEKYTPLVKRKGKFPFWYSKELRDLIKKKERCHRKWKRTKSASAYIEFSNTRAQCKTGIETCHKKYIESLQTNIKQNIKLFWSYTKSRKQSNSYPSLFKHNDSVYSDPQIICDLFSSHFQSTFTDHHSDASINVTHDVSPQIQNPFNINPSDIESILNSLDER